MLFKDSYWPLGLLNSSYVCIQKKRQHKYTMNFWLFYMSFHIRSHNCEWWLGWKSWVNSAANSPARILERHSPLSTFCQMLLEKQNDNQVCFLHQSKLPWWCDRDWKINGVIKKKPVFNHRSSHGIGRGEKKGRVLQIILFLRREEIWEIQRGANHTTNAACLKD